MKSDDNGPAGGTRESLRATADYCLQRVHREMLSKDRETALVWATERGYLEISTHESTS